MQELAAEQTSKKGAIKPNRSFFHSNELRHFVIFGDGQAKGPKQDFYRSNIACI